MSDSILEDMTVACSRYVIYKNFNGRVNCVFVQRILTKVTLMSLFALMLIDLAVD